MQTDTVITPVQIVKKNNLLVLNIENLSKKWNKRWSHIEQPWPVCGTFNLNVIQTMRVLINTYKANQKTGKKGLKRTEKRNIELAVLQLFHDEGQKRLLARRGGNAEEEELPAHTTLLTSSKEHDQCSKQTTDELMREVEKPFSHLASNVGPPPYKETKSIYPQLPVIDQTGSYAIQNDRQQIVETGDAHATIVLNPSTKSKVTSRKHTTFTSDTPSDTELAMGGYGATVKNILEKLESQGNRHSKLFKLSSSSSEEHPDSSEDEVESRDFEEQSYRAADAKKALEELRKVKSACRAEMKLATSEDHQKYLSDQLQQMKIQEKELERKANKNVTTS